MKKLRKLQKEKLKAIEQCDYDVIDLITYNQMVRLNTLQNDKLTKVLNIIFNNTYSEIAKYRKIKQLLLKGEEL